jgi:predicted dehydrogenase
VALAGRAAAADGPIRVGIIGLDTSHAVAFTKLLNDPAAPPELAGCPVVAAYPRGSADIESSVSRVPGYTAEMRELGVEIVDSIPALLERVDAVLLETNDGRPHLEQVRPVLAAGKPVFIDKPVAASLADAVTIYREALIAGVPVFSASSLRYGQGTQAVRAGSIGRVEACETTSPAHREPHHPDLFWYGIHGVESLFTVLGTGCQTAARTSVDGRIVVTGSWAGGRTGTFREAEGYGGVARGEQGEAAVGASDGYRPLVERIVAFFRTGVPPVRAEETLEILAFMEAADESARQGGAAVSLASVMRKAAGFTPLCNGTDLAGWQGLVGDPKSRAAMPAAARAAAQAEADAEMRAHWSVADGVLRFDGKGQNLCTASDYGDFELFVDWKIGVGGDSGVYLRGTPQVQIWDTTFPKYLPLGADKGSGAFWNNKVHPRFPTLKADRPVGEWNSFFIHMVGERATVVLNGETVVDDVVMENYWDRTRPVDPRGQIELQNHGNELFFRELFVREIPAAEANAILAARGRAEPGFEPVFNGRDLAGWRGDRDSYEVIDGAIVCKVGRGGTLFTDREYGDFVAQLEFKLPPAGNNGLAIRYSGTGQPSLDGVEIQVLDSEHEKYATLDRRQYHGSVYGLAAATRGYLRPTGEWNFQEVTVRGSRYRVELNGFTILDVDLDTVNESKDGPVPPGAARRRGHFGFCGHHDPVAFRRIMIRELPAGRPGG